MRSAFFFQLSIIILAFTFSPAPLLPRSPSPHLPCSPYYAPLLITYHHPLHTTSRLTLTAVFNPDDLLIERSFYTRNGRSWHTDIVPGAAGCPAQIQTFLDYTLGTLNTGSPPFRYTQGHDLTAYTDFLRQAHRLCSETAMQHTGCQWQRLYLPVLRVAE